MASYYEIQVDGHDELMFALRKASKELRGTSQQSEIYKVGVKAAKSVAIPMLKASSRAGGAPPQAKKTATNLKAKRGRVPKAEFENKAGNFTSPRWKSDRPAWGAIYWGSLFGGSKYFGPSSQWIDAALARISPLTLAHYQRGVTRLLRKADLL